MDYTAAIRQGAGVGRHTRSLVSALLEITKDKPEIEFSLFYASGDLSGSQQAFILGQRKQPPANARYAALPFSERDLTRLWQRLKIPLPLEAVAWLGNPFSYPAPLAGLDLLHFPDFTLPPHFKKPDIVTIHDLSFLIVPENSEAGLRRYLAEAVPRTVKKADKIIVVSESIKQELIERLGTPPEKIEVIYNGVGPQFQPFGEAQREEMEAVRDRHKLPEKFALFVSTIEPRKNLVRLVEAWDKVRQTPAGKQRKLVLAGRRGWLYEPIFRRISELKLTEDILWLDFVPDADLPALYNLADIFVFPSLYEGFGIPPLEALACGTPVVTANNSALKEIFEGAAFMCDAGDTNSIAQAIIQTLEDLDGPQKLIQEYRTEGLARAHRFSWENAARQTLEIYQKLR